MTSEPRPERQEPEPLSPELVLVSPPDAARRAREELPPPASFETARASRSAAPRRVPEPPPYQWIETEPEPPVVEPTRPWRRVPLVLGGCLLALAGVAWYVSTQRDEPHQARVADGAAPTAPAGTGTVTTPHTGTQTAGKPGATGTVGTQPPRTHTRAQPGAAKPKPKAKPGSTPTKAVVGFVPARTWTWSTRKGARAYVFRMTLDGREILRVRTRKPRFQLPRSFRFHAGKYRWTVLPLPVPKDGRALVDSRFVVTPGAAAIANR